MTDDRSSGVAAVRVQERRLRFWLSRASRWSGQVAAAQRVIAIPLGTRPILIGLAAVLVAVAIDRIALTDPDDPKTFSCCEPGCTASTR
jgi:hypothetical protein